jgi:hypothetical protein
MAFLDVDEEGDFFANVSHQVGPGRPNQMDDVLLVQICLYMHFGVTDSKRGIKSVDDLQKMELGLPDEATFQMIKEFQGTVLKRPKPEGYVNTAIGKRKFPTTIGRLNSKLGIALQTMKDPRDQFDFLRSFPSLGASLQVQTVHETVIVGKTKNK